MRVFVAGASGVIGRSLLPLLVDAGHDVVGMTRDPGKLDAIRSSGARAVVVDVFDRPSLVAAVTAHRAEVVIHQLTDLTTPPGTPIGRVELARNARVRREGTGNLVEAAVRAGAGRLIAQSVAWLYAPGREPNDEHDPLLPVGINAAVTLVAVHDLERQILDDHRFTGLVLRYGRLYGEGTWTMTPPESPTVSVAAAARAASLAVHRGTAGAYNIVDDNGPVANGRARRELGWRPERINFAPSLR